MFDNGKGNEICLTSFSDLSNKQWPSTIEKRFFFISGLSVITLTDGEEGRNRVIKRAH